ncbi:VirK, required for proper localization of IcsA at the surface of bacteria [Xenorhabdus beddingii]|uniref:VirK, required for proper localization of IcsA at the surface of bacteria n=1 Tax=Xenorhabdus beddingii TaxID=40578 RepID=A0A1Y2SMK7_9GAMM|nr:VirK/YbjX family protein [Xenorhabdus beddingii]OTA20181.1 VirK, required for proper localization of IcsA at the surface of bacteria [Xenorhabdus beddingii]
MNHLQQSASSGVKLFAALVGKRVTPGEHWLSSGNRTKFALRSILTPVSTLKLLDSLAKTPRYLDILKKQPSLPCKLHRPYLSINFKRKHIVCALNEHYKLLFQHLEPAIISKLFDTHAYLLATIQGKNESFMIYIDSLDNLNKEGELSLYITTAENVILAKCAFTLLTVDGKQTLFIGVLQGPAKGDNSLDIIRHATKECYGLFPKRLLIEAICRFAEHVDCEQILAVSNETHIYRSIRYWHKKKDKMVADYNAFWESLSGVRKENNDFHLPSIIERKSLDDIPSKKRAEYRRRYQLLDELENSIKASLTA